MCSALNLSFPFRPVPCGRLLIVQRFSHYQSRWRLLSSCESLVASPTSRTVLYGQFAFLPNAACGPFNRRNCLPKTSISLINVVCAALVKTMDGWNRVQVNSSVLTRIFVPVSPRTRACPFNRRLPKNPAELFFGNFLARSNIRVFPVLRRRIVILLEALRLKIA